MVDEALELEAVFLRRAPNSWVVKITGTKLKGWVGPIPFNLATWPGGEPPPGKPRLLRVQRWWVDRKIRRI
jgi:hypothetical protein